MKPGTEERITAFTFNPLMRYNMRRKDLQALLVAVPRPAFWMGRMYTIKSHSIGPGIYEVTGDFSK